MPILRKSKSNSVGKEKINSDQLKLCYYLQKVINRDVDMLSGLVKTITLSSVILIVSGCGAGGDEPESPENSISDSIVSPRIIQNEQCPNGGVEIQLGIDANGNGLLDSEEVDHDRTQTICNGSDGVNGENGSSGAGGLNSLVFIADSPDGECEYGGKTVTIGLDSNQNGVLDQEETVQSQTICNVVSGDDGIDSLVQTTEEPIGENCSGGGLKIDSGLDGNGNNTLDEEEIQSTSYICHGVDGQDGQSVDLSELLIETISEAKGANCLHGGGKHQIGLDTNDNGQLEPEEILSASYSCNENSPPTIHFTHDGQIIAGTQYTIELIGQDAYGDDVVLSIVNKPVWLTETRLAEDRIQLSGLAPSEINQSFIIEASATDSDLTGSAQLSLNTIEGILLSAIAESVTEGNLGSQEVAFSVQLSTAATEVLQVHYNLVSATSKQGQDWQADNYSGVLVFSEGEIAKQIPLEILSDQRFELDETIALKIQSLDYAGSELVQVADYTLLHIMNDDQLVIHADQENSVPVYTVYDGDIVDVALSDQPAWMATATQWQSGQAVALTGNPSAEDIGTQGSAALSIASSSNYGIITSATYHIEYTISEGDRDGDGVVNSQDAFPDNASAQTDSDSDGLGDEWEISQFEDLDLANNLSDFDGNDVTDLSAFQNNTPVNDISFSFESGALPDGWMNIGDVDWIVSNEKNYHGDYALTVAQQLEPGQVARVNFEITTQAGLVSFFSKREVDIPYNFELRIWVDNSPMSYNVDSDYWKSSTVLFTAGKHQVGIEYGNFSAVGIAPLVYLDHISGLLGIVPGDRDGDGVTNAADLFPDRVDAATDNDNDGIGDEWELKYCPDAIHGSNLCDVENSSLNNYSADGDFDNDGLGDINEFFAGTLPYDTDSDNDGPYANDFPEHTCLFGNLPANYCNDDSVDLFPADSRYRDDVDGDGLADKWELRYFADLGVSDGSQDSDGDSLTDAQEFVFDSMPAVDSDSDGVADVVDAFPNDSRYALDVDSDGIADEWENSHGGIHIFSADGDYDHDQRTDLNEFIFETDPSVIDVNAATDTDNDGLGDEWEMVNFQSLDIANAISDFDGNGVTDLSAFQNNTGVRDGMVTHVFDVLNNIIALGSDLIFYGSTDGTAYVGSDGGNPALNALNDLDGGISTLAPIDLNLTGSITPASIDATNVFLVRLPNAADAATMTLPLIELDENGSFVGAYNAVITLDTGHTTRQMVALDLDALSLATIGALFSPLKADGTAPAAATETVAFSNFAAIVASQPALGTDYNVEVIELDGVADSTIRIVPLKPLDGKTKYITVLTSGVTDADGEAITMARSYDQLTGTGELPSPALAPVRALYQNLEALATTIITVAGTQPNLLAGDIVSTTARTTIDPGMVLKSMAYPGYWAASAVVQNNETIAAGILAGAVAQGAFDQATVDALTAVGLAIPVAAAVVSGALTTDMGAGISYEHPRVRSFEMILNAGGAGVHQIPVSSLTAGALTDNVLISQGAIELPQYVDAMTTDASDYWEGSASVGAVLDALEGNTSGTTPPSDVDGEKNVTYRFPFAQKKRDIVVPIMMFEPIADSVAAALAAQAVAAGLTTAVAADYMSTGPTGTGCVKPAAGWPVSIIQHGFTTERSANLINAVKIVDLTCHAMVSMDLPHHGIAATSTLAFGVDYVDPDNAALTPFATAKAAYVAAVSADATILDTLAERHENFYGVGGVPTVMDFGATKAGDSGSLWIRLDNFQRGRDNMRQGVMDLLNLNATLSAIDLNGDGIADLDVTNVNYIGHSLGGIVGATFVAVNNDATVQAGNTNLPKVQKAILATPGGSIAKMIESSVAIGPQVILGLAENQVDQSTIAFESFIQVFQATLDTADPLNFISDLAAGGSSDTPTLMLEMVGNVLTGIPSDLVVPNNGIGDFLASGAVRPESAQSPFIGTDPMISLLGAENVVDTPTGNKLVAKYNEGGHGTFSSAGTSTDATSFDSSAAYAEMLSQSVQFILTGAITPANTAVLVSDVTP